MGRKIKNRTEEIERCVLVPIDLFILAKNSDTNNKYYNCKF